MTASQVLTPHDGRLVPGVPVPPQIDFPAAEQEAAALLTALGVPTDSETARRTPRRMVAGLTELLTSPPWEFTTFPNQEAHHDLVIARDIPFTSLCAHHLLPFAGIAHVGIIPGDRIAGLSKLARTVQAFAARLQVQEELGQQIAAFLETRLDGLGVGVVLEAEHLCMTRRGAQATGARTVTIACRGQLRPGVNPAMRAEFLQVINRQTYR